MQQFARFSRYRHVRAFELTHKPLKNRFQTIMSAAETDTQANDIANASGITPSALKSTLTQRLEAQYVDVEDVSGGCGQSFEAKIVSPLFDKKTTLARHRLVNSALKAEIAAIHAWTPKCYTPEEWRRIQSSAAE